MIRHTSQRWSEIHPDLMILDPDGWDRKNFRFSWFEELITEEEYFHRLSHSTCLGNYSELKTKGHRFKTDEEWMAYEKGREDEQEVIWEWIKNWDGSPNSSGGQILLSKFKELRNV